MIDKTTLDNLDRKHTMLNFKRDSHCMLLITSISKKALELEQMDLVNCKVKLKVTIPRRITETNSIKVLSSLLFLNKIPSIFLKVSLLTLTSFQMLKKIGLKHRRQ
jgi:hypothetical protein